MTDLQKNVSAFLSQVDALAERLTPQERPQDANAPECSRRELQALRVLESHGPLTMTALAKLLDVPLSTATADPGVVRARIERL